MATEHVIRVLPTDSPGLVRTAESRVDERWLRAFAAAVGDTRDEFFDLDRGIVGHPVFPVCVEWPLIEQGAPGIELSEDTLRLGLHVGHRIRLRSPLRPGERVRTEARLHRAEARTGAALIVTEFRTTTPGGTLLVTSQVSTLYRGVRLEGGEIVVPSPKPRSVELSRIATFETDTANAVVYSECARIWNPIHTDIRVARAAGLADTVLHGTETLARAVSAVTRAYPGADVTGVDCRFTNPVFPGMTLSVHAGRTRSAAVAFDVRAADGTPVLADGLLAFAAESS
ncbi:MaoC/PaaZ C-terminal domain-containing protein [Amycolatopsis sp. NPDC059090]|uniref:MaoC/PaaZ C-terminal domain-containing protein n=1 Tax=unclassified Amycolatopsis TaxID=2618356 RepID=UPI003670C880